MYRRSDRELSVTLPARRYNLAGQLLATAIDDSTRASTPVLDAVHSSAAECGRASGTRRGTPWDHDPGQRNRYPRSVPS